MNMCEPATRLSPTPHQLVIREVNVRIAELGARYTTGDSRYKFCCECADPNCVQWILLELNRFDPTMPAGALVAHVPDSEQEPSM